MHGPQVLTSFSFSIILVTNADCACFATIIVFVNQLLNVLVTVSAYTIPNKPVCLAWLEGRFSAQRLVGPGANSLTRNVLYDFTRFL